ncbi:MAG: CDGSH iron-sulfur domain-containing protein [Actinomycetota bacterium]|nr:CDGSH iron-sulfur domain-containing protein [Actinomycetota bacterium]MDH5224253.1 CDGSH iron-sulfur domain-containing protein [Actinomycetota bacterium]MDH5312362.1 CDGSH iron-sulfur domain-containing protein [Actinomycetota bacterium]
MQRDRDSSPRTISVREDGPYIVRGDVPLGRTAQVETEHGEPVGWVPDEPLDASETYELCRCGRSKTKPFCDASHESGGFDGAETAPRDTIAERRYEFPAGEGTVSFDLAMCQHAGYCGDRFTNWRRLARQAADPAVRERLMQMVRLCPSGALEMRPDPDGDQLEPALAESIGVVRDGPYLVRGGISVTSADGETYEVRNRVTLCRCGHSETKPFCDGSHARVGFTDG